PYRRCHEPWRDHPKGSIMTLGKGAARVRGLGWPGGIAFALLVVLAQPSPVTAAPTTSPTNVKVVNAATDAVPVTTQGVGLVRDVDRAGAHPFQWSTLLSLTENDTCAMDHFVVPAGKRAVVEYVSATGAIGETQMIGMGLSTSLDRTAFTNVFAGDHGSFGT